MLKEKSLGLLTQGCYFAGLACGFWAGWICNGIAANQCAWIVGGAFFIAAVLIVCCLREVKAESDAR